MQDNIHHRNSMAGQHSSPQLIGGTTFFTATRWRDNILHRRAVE
jgi:hypothetical protein